MRDVIKGRKRTKTGVFVKLKEESLNSQKGLTSSSAAEGVFQCPGSSKALQSPKGGLGVPELPTILWLDICLKMGNPLNGVLTRAGKCIIKMDLSGLLLLTFCRRCHTQGNNWCHALGCSGTFFCTIFQTLTIAFLPQKAHLTTTHNISKCAHTQNK